MQLQLVYIYIFYHVKRSSGGDQQHGCLLSWSGDALLQFFPLQLLLGDRLLLLRRKCLLRVHIQRIVPHKKEQQEACNYKQDYHSWVQALVHLLDDHNVLKQW